MKFVRSSLTVAYILTSNPGSYSESRIVPGSDSAQIIRHPRDVTPMLHLVTETSDAPLSARRVLLVCSRPCLAPSCRKLGTGQQYAPASITPLSACSDTLSWTQSTRTEAHPLSLGILSASYDISPPPHLQRNTPLALPRPTPRPAPWRALRFSHGPHSMVRHQGIRRTVPGPAFLPHPPQSTPVAA